MANNKKFKKGLIMKDLSNENVIHIVDGDVQYLQFRKLLEYKDKIQHCFSLRPLNFKRNAKEEDRDYVRLCDKLNLSNAKIVRPRQVHGNKVEIAKEDSTGFEFSECDGLITDVKEKVLSLVFADCLSLILYDPVKNVIGDIHSGWKGTVKKIGQVAAKKMISEFGCNPENIICCFGPAIHKCHFQVEEDVKNQFLGAFNDESIIEVGPIIDGVQKYYIDPIEANKKMLIECGLKRDNIIDSGICTVCNCDEFHSYRAHRENSGRNTAIISLL